MRPIKFNDEAFNRDLQKYQDREKLKAELKVEFELLLPEYKYDEEKLFKDPVGYLYESLEVKYKKQNTLHLTGLKLAELLQINTDRYRKTAFKFNNDFKHILEEPQVEAYTIYATTEEELKRLEYCEKYIQIIEDYESEFGGRVFPKNAILSHSPQVVFFNFRLNHYEPNLNFVKPNEYRHRGF